MNLKQGAILSLLVMASVLPAQTLDLSLAPADPGNSFNTGPTGINAALTNIVRTERLTVTLTSNPTIPNPPPAQLTPRRVALWVGAYDPVGTMFPEGMVFLGLTGSPMAIPLFDSFSNPFAPIFGPPLQGPTNTITLTLGANLFDSFAMLPPGGLDLALQAITEDTPGGVGLILSQPARFQLIDPELEGFTPTITGIATVPATSPPQGPETGGTVVMISGTNFLAQSDWANPNTAPTVTFGGTPATFTILDNNTIMAVAPARTPTSPPTTAACFQDVVYTNDQNFIAPNGVTPATSPVPFLYKSGGTPVITGFDMANGSPEGGYTRQIQGSWFLDGLTVTFTSQSNPSLTVTLSAPDVLPSAGGTIITVDMAMPPFCTGPVDVVVNNCDQESSAPATFTYDVLQPTITSGTPTTTAPTELGGITFIAINETGTALTLTGTNILEPTSPLATAATVIPGAYYPTRFFVDNVLDTGVQPTAPTTMAGTTAAFSATSTERPELGFKEIRIENSPCVNTGNTQPISNPPCPPQTPPCTVVLQDSNPPTVNDVFPGIGVNTGNTFVEVRGDNFFSLQTGVLTQDFSSFANPGGEITQIDATALIVPAVQFGTRFASDVEIISQQILRVRVPAAVVTTGTSTVQVTVHNPDLQRATAPANFTYVPPITNPNDLVDPLTPTFDADKIRDIAAGGPGPIPGAVPGFGPGPVIAPGITIIENPSPNRDAQQDPLGVLPGVSYDYVFLFNTRLPGPPPGATRRFSFTDIDLPQTITLPNGGWAFRPPIDPTLPALFDPGSIRPIPAGTTIRVIIKAFGYRLGPNNRIIFDPADNPPLVLLSHNDLNVDAMIDCAGDAFMIEAYATAQGAAVGGPFRVRVERTIPPAGAGQGGRGGAFFPEGEVQLPGPNFGVGPGILAGGNGFPAPGRYDVMSAGTAVQTFGTSGTGAAPIGVQSGAGGGAGYVTAGTNGTSGTSPGGFGGQTFGTATGPLPLPTGAPSDDRLVFGSNAVDFTRFADGSAFDSGTLFGGSGGGGGGGGLAIFVPALTLGGRGGNGGGCVVLLANRLLNIRAGGAIFAQGEQGQLGVDEFPVYNGDPVIPVNLPGAGGSGSGGTILGLAVANICFDYGSSTVCPPVGALVPPPAGYVQIDASGVAGGPEPAPGLMNPGVPAGGVGSEGRIRFAISDQSPYVADFTSDLNGMFGTGLVFPAPPMAATLPPAYFAFPLP